MIQTFFQASKRQNKTLKCSFFFAIIDKWAQSLISKQNCEEEDGEDDQTQSFRQNQKKNNYSFKYKLSKILPLPKDLLATVIKYTCLVQFSFMFQDISTHLQTELSIQLKSIYTNQIYQGNWKDQFNYQFTMVLLVKEICNFIQENFCSIKRNQAMQSQIFVILQRVFLGIEISHKAYGILLKKYTIHNLQNRINAIKTNIALISIKKNATPSNQIKTSNQFISHASFRNYKAAFKRSQKHKVSFIPQVEDEEKDNIEEFQDNLKVSLHVDPLPMIKPLRQSIGTFATRKMGLTCIKTQQSPQRINKMKQSIYFRTHALSSSIEASLGKVNRLSDKAKINQQKIKLTRQSKVPQYSINNIHTQEKKNKDQIKKSKRIIQPKTQKRIYRNTNKRLQKRFQKRFQKRIDLQSRTTKRCERDNEQWFEIIRKMKNNSRNSYIFHQEKHLDMHKLIENRKKSEIISTSHNISCQKQNIKHQNQNQDEKELKFEKINCNLMKTFNNLNIKKQLCNNNQLRQSATKNKTQKKLYQRFSDISNRTTNNQETSLLSKKYIQSVTYTQSNIQREDVKIREELQNQQKKKKKKELAKICSLKMDKTSFFKQCVLREQRINHSMFALCAKYRGVT